ncbi:MAG: hypothetical protein CTY12_00535 [Methylotenera sp.]|nr:MAG: hypothetical protein CTY12_00535 [Methylotenera sp.]
MTLCLIVILADVKKFQDQKITKMATQVVNVNGIAVPNKVLIAHAKANGQSKANANMEKNNAIKPSKQITIRVKPMTSSQSIPRRPIRLVLNEVSSERTHLLHADNHDLN